MIPIPTGTLLKFGIPLLIVGALVIGLFIQTNRLDTCNGNLDVCGKQLTHCTEVNASNVQAVAQIKRDAETAQKTCDELVAAKDRTIKKLKAVDDKKGGSDAKTDSDDAVLLALNGMFKRANTDNRD